MFAASGPGVYGATGTSDRGYDFEGDGGRDDEGCERAGWFGVDKTAQGASTRFHLESTLICEGTDTDMSAAGQPWTPGDVFNDFAIWCGEFEVCGWVSPNGYGNDWRGHCDALIDETDFATELTINFAYNAFFEGDVWDFFELEIKVGDEWDLIYDNHESGEGVYTDHSFTISKASYPPGSTFGPVRWTFNSDGAWSDQDGLFPTNVGAMWIDNIELLDGANVIFRDDFESGVVPAWIQFVNPPGSGDFAALYTNLYAEDICILNSSCAWAFFDPDTNEPNYPIPVIPYGPPYAKNVANSPTLEMVHELGNPVGTPFVMTPETTIYCNYWVYVDLPANPVLYYNVEAAARVAGQPCLNFFTDDGYVTYGDYQQWFPGDDVTFVSEEITQYVLDSANGEAVTGLAIQAGCWDMCRYWCDEPGHGDGTGHTPGPFFDNLEVKIIAASAVSWEYDIARRFQDNFPGGNGFVRIDPAVNVEPTASPTVVRGDSAMIELNMDALGGIKHVFNTAAGEMRPNFWLIWKVVAGPHAGVIDANMADPFGDPDPGGAGCYSPWDGTYTDHPDGETWMQMVADSSRYQGTVQPNKWAFDFNDTYFLPGDEIAFFFKAEADNGTVENLPTWAESTQEPPDWLQSTYRVRCLPTSGTHMLFVEDYFNLNFWWRQGFIYNGYQNYDRFFVQAGGSGLENGLGGMTGGDVTKLNAYNVIVWDSGGIEPYSVTNQTQGDKTFDTVLLQDFLSDLQHSAYLWMMGDRIATNLGNGESFLNLTLGVTLAAEDFYAQHTEGWNEGVGWLVPTARAIHPALAYLGQPEIAVYGGCPVPRDFALVDATGPSTEITHEWDPAPTDLDAQAGVYNRDPDGNGNDNNNAGFPTRTLFNPFSYSRVRDVGWGLAAGVDYSKKMVGDVLNALFSWPADSPPDDADVPVYVTKLNGNFPNPFNPKTKITFSLGSTEHVNLSVYDITGRLVTELVNERMDAGQHEVDWDGKNHNGHRVASGVYFYKMSAGAYTATDRMVMLK